MLDLLFPMRQDYQRVRDNEISDCMAVTYIARQPVCIATQRNEDLE